MLQIYAHRARCVHFITQQKLTNHYNKNSTIKAKPLIFSGLALFFTFFKPRHPISVKKLRANRRFPPFSLRERRRRLPSQGYVYPAAALFPQQFSVGKRLEDAHQFGVARCGCRGRRRAPADDMSDALRPPGGSPRSCGSRC